MTSTDVMINRVIEVDYSANNNSISTKSETVTGTTTSPVSSASIMNAIENAKKNLIETMMSVGATTGTTSSTGVDNIAPPPQKKKYDIENDPRTEGMDDEAKARYELYLQSKTDNFIRLDITASVLKNMPEWQRSDFLIGLPTNRTIKTIHLSGHALQTILKDEQINELVAEGIANLVNLQELFVFHGNCPILNEDLIAQCIAKANQLKVVMFWQFHNMSSSPTLAANLRMHPNIERLTINLPTNFKADWGCFDLYIMAFSGMPKLRVLQVRCDSKKRQTESIISPEAIVVLMNSESIQSLYLENVGLIDDHIDAIADELSLINNTTLKSIDFKDNLFTEDVLYTFGQMLPKNTTLQSLDISGCHITHDAGIALANGILHKNTTLTHLEIDGVYERYKDEFTIPEGYQNTPWMQDIYYQLRMNRAYQEAGGRHVIEHFQSCRRLVSAIIHVSDHLGCIYDLVRTHSTIIANNITADPLVDIQL